MNNLTLELIGRFPFDVIEKLIELKILNPLRGYLKFKQIDFNFKCSSCGQKVKYINLYKNRFSTTEYHFLLEDGNEITKHHIKFKKDGGTNDLKNLELKCESCHRTFHEKQFINLFDDATLIF